MVKGIGISLGELSVWKRKMGLAEGHMGFFHSVPRSTVLMIEKLSIRLCSVPISERNREKESENWCQGKL